MVKRRRRASSSVCLFPLRAASPPPILPKRPERPRDLATMDSAAAYWRRGELVVLERCEALAQCAALVLYLRARPACDAWCASI